MEHEYVDPMTRISMFRLLPDTIRECCNLARVPAPLSKSSARYHQNNRARLHTTDYDITSCQHVLSVIAESANQSIAPGIVPSAPQR